MQVTDITRAWFGLLGAEDRAVVRVAIVMVITGALWLVSAVAHAGKLGAMRSETSGSGSSSGSSSSGGSGSVDLGGAVEGLAAFGEFVVDVYIDNVMRLYTRYPYADGEHGFVLVVDPEDPDPPGQVVSGTLSLHGAYFEPTLGRAGLDLEFMARRFGFAVDAQPHLETDPFDALTLGSAAVMTAFVLEPRWQLYGGLGVGFMLDGRVHHPDERVDVLGINGTFRTTVLPVRPLVLRARFDVGRLGAAKSMLGRATAGLMARRFEFFGGYEARKVGQVVTHGPTGGVRMWF